MVILHGKQGMACDNIRIANSLDPDETPRSVASHLDPNCLQRPSKFGSSTERAKGKG